MGDANDWTELISFLPSDYSYAAITLPGHLENDDFTDVESLLSNISEYFDSLFEQIEQKDIIIYAYSMGGRLLLEYLSHNPVSKKLKACILESVSPGIQKNTDRIDRVKQDNKLAEELRKKGIERFLKQWMQLPLFQNMIEKHPKKYHLLIEKRQKMNPEALALWLNKFSPGKIDSHWDLFQKLQIPLLCLAGEDDTKYLDIMERVADYSKKNKFEKIPNAGHNCHFENPEKTANKIVNFLGELSFVN